MAGMIRPFMFRGLIGKSDNLNNLGDGIYSTIDENIPSNSPDGSYNSVIIQVSNLFRDDKYQIVFQGNNRKIYIRSKFAGYWNSWHEHGDF